MPWLSITLKAEGGRAEALSDALLEAGALAVVLEDAAPGEVPKDGSDWNEPPSWSCTRLTALAEAGADACDLVARAAAGCGIEAPAFATARVEDEDWVRRSQSQFGPIRAGERLWVVPSWSAAPDPGAVNLRLDPGLAFGTGSHPSTRLVLRWLERSVRGGERLLDYGCGSGVLAIAALRLGVREALAVDIDPRALEAAQANARANGVALATALPEALAPEHTGYDLVVANILAATLAALAPALAARARPGGRIALSGILREQVPELIAACGRYFDLALADAEEGWALVAGVRR